MDSSPAVTTPSAPTAASAPPLEDCLRLLRGERDRSWRASSESTSSPHPEWMKLHQVHQKMPGWESQAGLQEQRCSHQEHGRNNPIP
ncbi:hypothetical protein ZWY2020_010125 [Hordeum vulgare]|nr:hypothetical protein ZWY2020_010125 [Hordeum vulgare]